MNAGKDSDPLRLSASLWTNEQVARQGHALPSQLESAWLAGDEACRMAGDFVERRREGLKRAPLGACRGLAQWRGLVRSGHGGLPGQLMSLVML
jgi:hypothetical protein